MNDEHTSAYWMQKTMDAAHEAYDRLKDIVDFKNAIAEAEAIKQRMGIGEKKKITNGDRIRQMTDEELAAFIDIYDIEDICKTRCAKTGEARERCMCYGEECKGNIMQWLKQEVSEDADN